MSAPTRGHRTAQGGWDVWRHIQELRRTLTWSLGGWLLFSLVAWNWWSELWMIMEQPLHGIPNGPKLINTTPTGSVTVSFQVALVAGTLMATPWVLWQLWRFIAPALFPQEKKVALWSIFWTTILFVAGVMTGYFTIVPMTLRWLAGYGNQHFEQMWNVEQYTSMVVRLLLGFGTMFMFPLLTWVLGSLGLVTAKQLLSWSRGAIVAIFVLAAVLTPPDPVSQCLMAAPMLVLYFAGVGTAALATSKPREVR